MKSEQEYLEQAEEMANTAHKLAEQHEKESNIDEPTIQKVPVIGTKTKNDDYYINLVISVGPDEQKTVNIPWPDNTTDMSEPLVRLVQFYDVSIDDITELREIWVYTNDGKEYDVLIPLKNVDKFMENPSSKNIILGYNKLYAVESLRRNISKVLASSVFSVVLLYTALTNAYMLTTFYGFVFLALLFVNIFYITSKISDAYKTNNKNVGKMHKI